MTHALPHPTFVSVPVTIHHPSFSRVMCHIIFPFAIEHQSICRDEQPSPLPLVFLKHSDVRVAVSITQQPLAMIIPIPEITPVH